MPLYQVVQVDTNYLNNITGNRQQRKMDEVGQYYKLIRSLSQLGYSQFRQQADAM